MTDRKDINIDDLRKSLIARKAELLRLSGISEGARDTVELDQTLQGRLSRMDAMQQQEMAKETERRRQAEVQRIDMALSRIDTDDYGYCVSCDEEIAARRLELEPSIATCINCAGS
jgi:DnaK suppressor protein